MKILFTTTFILNGFIRNSDAKKERECNSGKYRIELSKEKRERKGGIHG